MSDVGKRAGPYEFRLYVAGAAPRSLQAIEVVSTLCETRFAGRYRLEVIDLYEHPERARSDSIVALPALVRERPAPRHVLVGDFLDEATVLHALGLTAEPPGDAAP